MNRLRVIGISGYATSGKDEAAKGLIERLGYQRVALADEVRKALYILNPMIGVQKAHPTAAPEPCYLRTMVDLLGWDEMKKVPEVRRLMQDMGTQVGRNFLNEDLWVNRASDTIRDEDIKKVVITDVRFPNEANWIKHECNGVVVRIEREGVGPATRPDGTVHESETSLDHWPGFARVIHNDRDVEALHSAICDTEHLTFRNLDGSL